MRGSVAVIVGVACIALMPAASDAGSVAAEIRTDPRQDQAGKEIRIVAFIVAHEPLSITGHGTVRVGGESRQLWQKRGCRELTPDGGCALKLRPTPKVAREIARRLTDGQVLHARYTVTLTNSAGVSQTTHYRAKLTKFRR
jgi:hypothetical protein